MRTVSITLGAECETLGESGVLSLSTARTQLTFTSAPEFTYPAPRALRQRNSIGQ